MQARLITAALVLALFGLCGWYHTAKVARLQSQIADLTRAKAEEVAERQRVAREHVEELAALAAQHAAQQQEKEDAYQADRQRLARDRAAAAADARGLREQLAASTARDRPGPAPDASTCERDQDRLERLGRLAGEGAELLVEAQGLLAERDAAVRRLADQVQIDRAAVSAAGSDP